MNYIVFDLEFNQAENSGKSYKNTVNPQCPFEIIQIGAIKLNDKFQSISTFNRLVKPEIYTSINSFVKEITNITIDLLNDAKSFKEIYKELVQFITSDKSILCVWGTADIKELFRNLEYHGLDAKLIPKEYINIQHHASRYLNCKKGTNIGLSNAVKALNIPLKDQFHDALNDAYYTTEVFKKIYNKNIKSKLYNLDKNLNTNRNNNIRTQLDSHKLFKQFEKMFNREVTDEEKSMIRLAYMMGKTNQFQKRN